MKKFCWENFNKIYILHIEGNASRSENIIELCKAIGNENVEIIKAITPESNGFLEDVDPLKLKSYPTCFRCNKISCGNSDCNNILIPAQIACFQTHHNVIRDIVKCEYQKALVLEDDVFMVEYMKELIRDPEENIKISNILNSEHPSLLKLGWAIDDRHLPNDSIYIENDDNFTMSNPAYALNLSAAKLLKEKLDQGITHTVDVIIHSSDIYGIKRYCAIPPFFSEKSWSTGEIESSIHPKNNYLECLSKELGKANKTNRTIINEKISEHKNKISNHIKHCDFIQKATLDLTMEAKSGINKESKINLTHSLDPLIQCIIFKQKPVHIQQLEIILDRNYANNSSLLSEINDIIKSIKNYKNHTSIMGKSLPSDAVNFLKDIKNITKGRAFVTIKEPPRTEPKLKKSGIANSIKLMTNNPSDSAQLFNKHFNFNVQSRYAYEFYLKSRIQKIGFKKISRNKISIIMVTYNAKNLIEGTIDSIFSQTFDDFELIILDGSPSIETTSEVRHFVNNYKDSTNVRCIILSGTDAGIYDAMNKAVNVSLGDWVIFMNAGDRFYNNEALNNLQSYTDTEVDFIYGNTALSNKDGSTLIKAGDNTKFFPLGNLFSHQSVLIRNDLQKKLKYDITYKIVADHNFYLRAYLQGKEFKKIPYTIATVDDSGASSDPIQRTLERWLSVRNEYNKHNIHKVDQVDSFYQSLLSQKTLPGPIKFYNDNMKKFNKLLEV